MYAIEFETYIKDDAIALPPKYKELNGQNVRIIVLKDDGVSSIESVGDAEQKYYEELLSNMSDDDKSISSKEIVDL